MKLPPLKLVMIVAIAIVLSVVATTWLSNRQPAAPLESAEETPAAASAVELENKVIVGEQAQKNLRISAKSLESETYWKTIKLPGMIVDRPGISDREVVAPAVGTVLEILHVPGDAVRPGDDLFRLRLASESLHDSQAALYKTSHDIALAKVQLERVRAAGDGVARSRVIEIESEIARLSAAATAHREHLVRRGLSHDDIEGVSQGKLVSEVSVKVPPIEPTLLRRMRQSEPASEFEPESLTLEVQQLAVEVGQQVDAGQTLCELANHRLIAIEGQAFRDEASLLEQSVREGWPVEVDFQDTAADWPAPSGPNRISYIASTVDPATRTFAFLLPLTNQSKSIEREGTTSTLWRFRTGQRVLLRIRVEKLEGVFVVPAAAVAVEGPETFVFTQNVNLFERKPVHVVHRDRDRAVIADDGSLPAYTKGDIRRTIPAVVQTAAAQLNRMTKAGSGDIPKGMHVHADGSLHKNEDEGK